MNMLHYITYKSDPDADWVTFIHGAGGSSSIWFKQIRDFRKHFNVLLLDLRGHGKSKQPIYEQFKRYTFDTIGNDVIAVLDHLQIKNTHFIGISMGTIIIREISERFPNRTKSMVMGGAVMKINFRGQILMNVGNLFQSVLPYIFLYKILAFIVMPRQRHKESRLLFVNEAKKLYKKEFKRWFTLISQVNPLLRSFRLKDIGLPTLYIMGSEDYMFLPSISKLVEDHTSSTLEIIPDCGHVVNVEQPLVFNKKVIEFLKEA